MNTSLGKSISIAVAAGAALMLGTLSGALALTYVQNSDHCTDVCTINTNNTVTVTATGNTLDIQVQLASGWNFVQTGSHQSFDFSLNGISPITGVINPLTSDAANWAFLNAVGTTVTGAASIQDNGLTIPSFAYALNHSGPGGLNLDGSFLEFTISAPGLTLASFNELLLNSGAASGSFFAADVRAANGATGVIDFAPVPGPLAGAGLPGLVMACGGLIAFARRRRKLAV